MFIHNFYGDLLLTVRVLFDQHIFQNRNYIKRYEFNMGNRAIQLPVDFKPNFEFPNIIVTLNDETTTFGQKTDVSLNLGLGNMDQTPVLYNPANNDVLSVQEEMVNIPITCTINCESQFQAKEIFVLIKRWLPISKFIQLFEYTSYLEVSPEFLSDNHFNPAIHQISNLYVKLNKRTGEIDYCFSLTYKPFIRLDSVSSSIPDSTQRSFQVVVDFTYMVQRPLYLFNDRLPSNVEGMNISIDPAGGFEPISDYPAGKMVNYLADDIANQENGFVRRSFVVSDESPKTVRKALWDQIILEPPEISETSASGRLSGIKGSDDYLYLTTNVNGVTKNFKALISSLPIPGGIPGVEYPVPPPTDVDFTVDCDHILSTHQENDTTIVSTLYKTTQTLTVQFDPKDFLMSNQYSYNLINGANTVKDFQDYTINFDENSVTFNISTCDFSKFAPSLTSPLTVQFYLKNAKYPKQIGGIQPHIGLVRITNITRTSAEITWVSDVKTTSQIEFGEETIDYNRFSDIKKDYTYDHRIVLRGLDCELLYHFRINTVSEGGETYVSDDYSFITALCPPLECSQFHIDDTGVLDENKIIYIENNPNRTPENGYVYHVTVDNRTDQNQPTGISGDMSTHIIVYVYPNTGVTPGWYNFGPF